MALCAVPVSGRCACPRKRHLDPCVYVCVCRVHAPSRHTQFKRSFTRHAHDAGQRGGGSRQHMQAPVALLNLPWAQAPRRGRRQGISRAQTASCNWSAPRPKERTHTLPFGRVAVRAPPSAPPSDQKKQCRKGVRHGHTQEAREGAPLTAHLKGAAKSAPGPTPRFGLRGRRHCVQTSAVLWTSSARAGVATVKPGLR